ncbi:hypothetical protein HN587_04705 [Candidatus Woesearchaeota archaeon]|jgi:hypothetical protein|nr:hypothetical protein [Candidatus Woesearchaeota archaeon]
MASKTKKQTQTDKKEPSKKKKINEKTKNTIKWVVGFVILLLILFFIRQKMMADPATAEPEFEPLQPLETQDLPEPTEPTPTEFVPEPQIEITPTPFETGEQISSEDVDDLKDKELAIDVTTTDDTSLLSNVECQYDEASGLLYVSLDMTNTGTETFTISPKGVSKDYNTYFKIRGIVDPNPGCTQEELTPSETTTCTKIGFDSPTYSNVEGVNRISIQAPGVTEALLVECPEMPELVEEVTESEVEIVE